MAQEPEVETPILEGVIVEESEVGSLITINVQDPVAIFSSQAAVSQILQVIESQARNFIPDASTPAGRKEIKSRAYRVTRTKTMLEDIGKNVAAVYKELPKRIDAGRKTIRERLEALTEEIAQPVTDFEAAEARIKVQVDDITSAPFRFGGATPEAIQQEINRIERIAVSDEAWGRFAGDAIEAKVGALNSLKALKVNREKEEADARELAILRRKQAEQEERDREAAIRREASEKATRESEARAQAEKDASLRREQEANLRARQAEQDRLDAERRQHEAEEREAQTKKGSADREARAREEERRQADQRAIEVEDQKRREAAEVDRVRLVREADVEHRRAFNREALADIELAITPPPVCPEGWLPKAILTALVTGKIRHMRVEY